MENQPTKDIFCAKDQAITPHIGAVDSNGEFVFTCTTPDCGRFIKFPAETTKDQFDELLVKHEEHNIGQVSIEAQEAKLSELISTDQQEVAAIEQTPVEPVIPAPTE